jgi:hypothetical protein
MLPSSRISKWFVMMTYGLILLAGCRSHTEVVRLDDRRLDPKPLHESIAILRGEPDRPYREIALVEVKKRALIPFRPPAGYAVHPELKLKAAQLGADAVIQVEYERDRLRATVTALGKAVKFLDSQNRVIP